MQPNGLGQRLVEGAIQRVQAHGLDGADPNDKLVVALYWMVRSELPRAIREELRPGTVERRWWPISSDMPVREVAIKVVLPGGLIAALVSVVTAIANRMLGG